MRACGFQHIKALDKLLTTIFHNGLKIFKPDLVVRRNPLRLMNEVVQFTPEPSQYYSETPQTFSAHIEPDLQICALPPTLILSLDEGSSAFCTLWFLCFVTRLRFFGVRDPSHREWNDTRNTLGDQNLWWVVLITTMAFNLPHGPWESSKFWNVIVGAIQSYVARASWSSASFSVLYEHICHDMGCVPSGTPEHMKQIFENILMSEAFTKKGNKTSTKRWFSWFDAFEDADKSFHSRILSFIMFGFMQGIYKDFTDVPLWRMEGEDGGLIFNGGEDEDEEENKVEAAAVNEYVEGADHANIQPDEKKQSIKENNDLKALRRKCKNSVHVAASIYCKDMMQTLCRIIFTMLSPIRFEHGKNARDCRSPENARRFYVAAANCRVFVILEQVCAKLQDVSALSYMNSKIDFGSGLPDNCTVDHPFIKEENDRAAKAMGIWLSCTMHRVGSMMWHFTSWPGLFALVASDILDEVHAGLTLLRSHYKAFLDAQLHMTKSHFVKKVVAASPFQWTVMEDIANFSVAPDHHSNEWRLGRLRSYAKALFSSWGQTKVVEDCFQRMRTREEGDTRSKIHNSLAYWSMPNEMKTIELHDRDSLDPDDLPELMCNETKVPKTVFDAKHHELSVDGTEDIMKTNCWPTFSAQSAQFQYATSVFLDLINHKASAATTDDERNAVWASSSCVWRGVLFSQGMVVKHATSGEYFVCIGFVGNLLVLLWKIEAVKIAKGKVVFAVGTGTNKNTYPFCCYCYQLGRLRRNSHHYYLANSYAFGRQ